MCPRVGSSMASTVAFHPIPFGSYRSTLRPRPIARRWSASSSRRAPTQNHSVAVSARSCGPTTPNFEVVVVENRPARASTEAMIEQHFRGDRRIRCVQEYRPGASHARNAGLACARGEVVAFTDDDVVVDRRWLRANIEALVGQDDVACVAGLILPLELESESQLLMEQFASFGKGFRAVHLPASRFPAGESAVPVHRRRDRIRREHDDPGRNWPASWAASTRVSARAHRPAGARTWSCSSGYSAPATPWPTSRGRSCGIAIPTAMPVLRRQVYRYGVGLGAMLAKQLIAGPDRGDFIRAVPAGIRYVRDPDSRKNAGKPANYPRALTWFERAGMVLGPFAYVLSIVQAVLRRLAGADVSTPFRTTRSIRQLRLAGGGVVPMARFSKHARSLRERGERPCSSSSPGRPRWLSGLLSRCASWRRWPRAWTPQNRSASRSFWGCSASLQDSR